ncbi:MAG TPA: hypothetical protein VIG88_11670 [Lysobacter sp.]
MSKSSAVLRTSLLALVVVAVSGCGWFHRGSRLYAGPAESRPLEVPPELDVASATVNTASGATASTTRQAATQASALGFTVAGTRDEVFAKVGDALARVPGVVIANRAPLIGAYDVNYGGSNFLVRVSAGEGGSYVAAVDPRGLPATGDAAKRLVGALKASLAP